MEPDLQSLYLAEPNEQGGVSAPFEVLRAGEFVKGGRKISVTEDHLDQMVRNFDALKERGGEVPIDRDHSFAMGQGSEAVGWVKGLARKGRSLLAKVKWTKDGSDAIRSDRYRFISAEFSTDWADEFGQKKGAALLAAGLTNRPHLKGLQPVALSEDVEIEDVRFLVPAVDPSVEPTPTPSVSPPSSETPPRVAETFTVEIAGEEQKLSAEQIVEVFSERDELKSKLETAETERDEAKEKLTEAEGKASESTKLSERVESLETKLLSEQRDKDLAQAHREGRIDATDETTEKWHKRYEKYGRDEAKSLLFDHPAESIPVTERGGGAGKEVTSAPEGTDPEAHELDGKVKTFCEKNNLDANKPEDYTRALEAVQG